MLLLRAVLALACIATALPAIAAEPASAASGLHDFDFERGNWQVQHRMLRPDGEWIEFDGTCSNDGLMQGAMNVEEHVFNRPGGVTRGVALRAYDAKTQIWAIWWVDSRDPHAALDPPVKGRFVDGVGTFESDGLVDGKPVRTRFVWSQITATSARWEQAYSHDAGKSWQTNWIMQFKRAP